MVLANYFKTKYARYCESLPSLTRGVCPPSHSDKDINDKTNELPKEKIVPANVTKKRSK